MDFVLSNAWVVVAIPLTLALLAGLFGRAMGKVIAWIMMLAPLTVLGTGILATARLLAAGASAEGAMESVSAGSVRWLLSAEMPVSLGWRIDGLTAVMLLVVGFVALMVMVFSVGYMAEDAGYARYFALLALFTASMAMLVIADGLVGLFIGWEAVGACSYLLIGFWFNKPSAAAAATKAFLTTRVGDVGLLLGLALLWTHVGAFDYATVLGAAPTLAPGIVTAIALLLFVGAAGKSAQFPLHIWLPDAMEGPTPVSALIHAATMVAAGVFLIARVWPIFEASADARLVVLAIGTFTALAAATIAVAQTDIKKVLAYSTISQLGFMFAALGAGAWVAAIFHLATHAGFKALLFLGSGSVIHGTGTQDMREMGGLLKKMPVTAWTWIIGSSALAGIPLLAGFFSKDEILHAVWGASPVAGGALFLASLLTAFYITRATQLTFFGDYRGAAHPHEGGWVMQVPLLALAVPAVFAGYFGSTIAELLGHEAEALNMTTAAISSVVAIGGVALGWLVYRQGTASEAVVSTRLGSTWETLRNAYYFDPAVYAVVVRPTQWVAEWLYNAIDRSVIDGLVEALGKIAVWIGDVLRRLQVGDAQWYGSLMGTGFIVLLVVAVMWGGR